VGGRDVLNNALCRIFLHWRATTQLCQRVWRCYRSQASSAAGLSLPYRHTSAVFTLFILAAWTRGVIARNSAPLPLRLLLGIGVTISLAFFIGICGVCCATLCMPLRITAHSPTRATV